MWNVVLPRKMRMTMTYTAHIVALFETSAEKDISNVGIRFELYLLMLAASEYRAFAGISFHLYVFKSNHLFYML
jgi:hypothetical protein